MSAKDIRLLEQILDITEEALLILEKGKPLTSTEHFVKVFDWQYACKDARKIIEIRENRRKKMAARSRKYRKNKQKA